jgi:hypothetical protein
MDWQTFQGVPVTKKTDFEVWKENVMRLIPTYTMLLPNYEESAAINTCESLKLTMALGSTQPLTEMSTSNLPRGKRRRDGP